MTREELEKKADMYAVDHLEGDSNEWIRGIIKDAYIAGYKDKFSTIVEADPEKERIKNKTNKEHIIGSISYTLVEHIDNSAPCSKCAFFKSSTLQCRFPVDDYKMECEHNSGTTHGWNTLEYRRIYKP